MENKIEEKSLSVILVEDNKADAKALQASLVKSKLMEKIEVFNSPLLAFERISADREGFNFMITDYSLPFMTGLELCKKLQENNISFPMMIMTDSGSENLIVEALNLGIDDYLIKDIHGEYLNLLPIIIKNVINRHQKEREKELAEKLLHEKSLELQRFTQTLELTIDQRTESLRKEIIERKKAEEQIIRLNKFLIVRSEINQIINKIRNQEELFNHICKIIVDNTQLLLVWVGIMDFEEVLVRPIAHFGKDTGYLVDIAISSRDIVEGRGPIGLSIHLDKPIISNDIEKDYSNLPWRNKALQFGYKSVASFPLKISGRVVGVLALYSDIGTHFNDSEVEILSAISNDVSLAMEVIEIEKNNKKVYEKMEKLSSVVEQSPSIVFITDKKGNIEYVNKAFTMSTQYTLNEVIGKNARILKSGAMSDKEYKNMWEKITNGQEWNGEFCNKRKDGELYWEYATIAPLRGNDGEITSYLKAAIDLTERRQLEEQLRQSQKMEAIGQLAGGVAHDFNNILYAITNYAFLIKMDIKEEDPIMKFVEGIQSSSERGSKLTQSMLAFSRKQIINPIPMDLNNVIKDIEKMLKRIIREDITIKTNLFSEPLMIMADNMQIDQILMNLTTNSRDAMPHGGVISITTSKFNYVKDIEHILGDLETGMYVLLTFSDTGIGMTKEIQAKVFDPFFTTKEVGKGTGLGLSTVFGAVRQNNGHIKIYSETGEGTTFKIYFLLIDAGNIELKSTHVDLYGKGTATILLAEDEPASRESTTILLRKIGYTVIVAEDGNKAVREFKAHKDDIELVILDIIMPGKNGKIVYDEIIKIKPEIKSLFISGYTDDIIAEKGILRDDLNFLSKPVSPDILLRTIVEILGKK
ncbi:MAG: response regulator [Nitrospirae bacterium]|nr:response regulator [Nitrospirota bacterium]